MKSVQFGDVQLYEHDLQTLSRGQWINDTVIEFIYEDLELNIFPKDPKIHFLRPGIAHLIPQILDPTCLGVNVTDCEVVFIPVNNNSGIKSGGSHWSLIVYLRSSNEMIHWDSNSPMNNCVVSEAFIRSFEVVLGVSGIKMINGNCIQQTNGLLLLNIGYDCGMHLICMSEILGSRYLKNASLKDPISSQDLDSQLVEDRRRQLYSRIQSLLCS